MAHTPGPWKWVKDTKRVNQLPELSGADGTEVLWLGNSEQYYPTEGTEPKPEDAALISAAPEMLKLLEELETLHVGAFDPRPSHRCPVCGWSHTRKFPKGHRKDCRLAAVLKQAKGEA